MMSHRTHPKLSTCIGSPIISDPKLHGSEQFFQEKVFKNRPKKCNNRKKTIAIKENQRDEHIFGYTTMLHRRLEFLCLIPCQFLFLLWCRRGNKNQINAVNFSFWRFFFCFGFFGKIKFGWNKNEFFTTAPKRKCLGLGSRARCWRFS